MANGFYANVAVERNYGSNVGMIAKNNTLVRIFVVRLGKGKYLCPAARGTYAATLALNRIHTNKCLGQLDRKLTLADAFVTGKQQ
jgi:hypothetical protein